MRKLIDKLASKRYTKVELDELGELTVWNVWRIKDPEKHGGMSSKTVWTVFIPILAIVIGALTVTKEDAPVRKMQGKSLLVYGVLLMLIGLFGGFTKD